MSRPAGRGRLGLPLGVPSVSGLIPGTICPLCSACSGNYWKNYEWSRFGSCQPVLDPGCTVHQACTWGLLLLLSGPGCPIHGGLSGMLCMSCDSKAAAQCSSGRIPWGNVGKEKAAGRGCMSPAECLMPWCGEGERWVLSQPSLRVCHHAHNDRLSCRGAGGRLCIHLRGALSAACVVDFSTGLWGLGQGRAEGGCSVWSVDSLRLSLFEL